MNAQGPTGRTRAFMNEPLGKVSKVCDPFPAHVFLFGKIRSKKFRYRLPPFWDLERTAGGKGSRGRPTGCWLGPPGGGIPSGFENALGRTNCQINRPHPNPNMTKELPNNLTGQILFALCGWNHGGSVAGRRRRLFLEGAGDAGGTPPPNCAVTVRRWAVGVAAPVPGPLDPPPRVAELHLGKKERIGPQQLMSGKSPHRNP